MDGSSGQERFEIVIIGGGQAGLAVGYHLTRRGRPCVILDANERIGDSWRKRWDSLRLFTPARSRGLPGWPSLRRRRRFPPRMRWRTTSRPTRRVSTSPFEPAYVWTGSQEERAGSS